MFNRVDRELPIHLALNAEAKWFKQGGCPGLDEIVQVATAPTLVGSELGVAAKRRALDEIARQHSSDRTSRAVRSVWHLLREGAPSGATITARATVEHIVVDSVIAHLVNPRLQDGLIASGKESVTSYLERCDEFAGELQASAALTKLGAELLADPGGTLLKQRKAPPRLLDPRNGVDIALTAD